ncbi:MAG TPA: hypothetical protein VL691_14025, partial [Vicinamibacteria bacterium]|nr:hypothetical protein [Vicinamibacteria bacterium]
MLPFNGLSDYARYLEGLYGAKSFQRKLAYLEYNFGPYLAAGQTALEIGPGLGEFCALAQGHRLGAVDIVDRDEAILRHVKSRFDVRHTWAMAAEELPSIETRLADYDRILMIQVL